MTGTGGALGTEGATGGGKELSVGVPGKSGTAGAAFEGWTVRGAAGAD